MIQIDWNRFLKSPVIINIVNVFPLTKMCTKSMRVYSRLWVKINVWLFHCLMEKIQAFHCYKEYDIIIMYFINWCFILIVCMILVKLYSGLGKNHGLVEYKLVEYIFSF